LRIDRLYTRNALATTRSASIPEAAAAMRHFRVGMLVVMDDSGASARRPVGIVTDRDLAMEGFAAESCNVGSIMTPIVATIRFDADVHEALGVMQAHGVRRLVVMGSEGRVQGILSIDDVIDGLSADLASAAAVLKGEIRVDAAGLGEVKVGG
jgi:predicted transcriptional regulator